MSATQDEMDRLVECAPGRLDDLFDCWMTTPDNQNYPIGRVDCQRNLFHLQIDAPSAIQQDEMKARRYLGRLGDPGKVGFWPWAAKTQRLRWPAVEIAHIRRKGLVAP